MVDKSEQKKQWEKIILNSYYPPYVNDDFFTCDPKMTEDITETGQKILKNLMSQKEYNDK
jgi:DNA polymerase elongation subunit (family B)